MYVVVAAEPLTVTVAVTVTTLTEPEAVVLEAPTAVFLNWSNLFPGLMAKTIPC